MLIARNRDWESTYRDRWAHDKVVRSTYGVNCTGSCSWNVYVKDGLITWETQAVDYPKTDANRPDHEPRGCPRGASFSWYTYSPVRLKHPYVRGSLLRAWRAAKEEHGGDPVAAFAQVARDGTYKAERGRGGFVRASWDEASQLVAAANVHTIAEHGPDRIAGFTPIPAMSPVSFSAGSRFISLIGGAMLTFYDWYADLPPASPQMLGDQTDVPESAGWWDASYLIVWGTNLPITRTPDAHFMTEARYRGQKVVVVSPDYSDHIKFADDWLAAHPGTDGALAMAMGHVILKELHLDRRVPRFVEYAKRFTDQPMLVTLDERDDDLAIRWASRSRSIPSSARCRWSGASCRSRRWSRRWRTTAMRPTRTTSSGRSTTCASRSSTWRTSSPRGTSRPCAACCTGSPRRARTCASARCWAWWKRSCRGTRG
jgi:nitrate reductase alpha subunit